MSTHQELKDRHRAVRDNFPTNLNLRVHRALSWWQRAEMADDDDARFIFLWIAFNAAYAQDLDIIYRPAEKSAFNMFLSKLSALDAAKQIDALIWQEFSGSIRVLLNTPYVLQSFWDFHSGKISEEEWTHRFDKDKKAANHALASANTPLLMGVVFNRLYTLRNQLMHGGATWNSTVNRKQLHDCVGILGKLVPLIIELMLNNPDTLWGEAYYPVVK